MDTISWINPVLNILVILGAIVGLWMAGILLPTVITGIHSESLREIISHPFAKIILWAALGALFALPLIDIVSWLGNLVNIVLESQGGSNVSTVLGMISPQVYSSFFLFLMLAVYGLTLWLAKDYLPAHGQFNQVERYFIILSIASLIYREIQIGFTQIFFFQLPNQNVQNYGITGFMLEILIGFAILAVILVGLNRFLPNHPASGE